VSSSGLVSSDDPADSEKGAAAVRFIDGRNHKMTAGGQGKADSMEEPDILSVDQQASRERLKLAKAISFASGAGMVAWNKFASLWLLSIGLTPTEVGVLKSAGLVSKSVCQPMWAIMSDMKLPALIHPALAPVSLHFVAICSCVLSLLLMEVLRQSAGRMAFQGILIVRTCWAMANSGSQLTDALVAQMSHKTKEGFGKQRLWGSIAWGSMSLLAGLLIDRYGLDVLFTYTFVARTIMIICTLVAMRKVQEACEGGTLVMVDPNPKKDGRVSGAELLRRIVPLLRERAQLSVLLAVVLLHGFVMVICENVVSMQIEREFKLSRALNGLSSTVALIASVPTYFHSKAIIEEHGHFRMIMGAQGLTACMLMLHSWVTPEHALAVLPIQAIKGGVVALFWSASVDLMQKGVDVNLQSTGQTALSWMYYTIGGGVGHIFWSAYYQNRGAPETYLLGSVLAFVNMGLLFAALRWCGTDTNTHIHRNDSVHGKRAGGIEMA